MGAGQDFSGPVPPSPNVEALPVFSIHVLHESDSRPEALYNLGSGSWLAWANDTAAHYAAIHCPRQRITDPRFADSRHTTAPTRHTKPSPARVECWRSLVQAHNSTRVHRQSPVKSTRVNALRKLTIFYHIVNNFTNRAPVIMNNLAVT